jgi:hypothetical protein
MTSNGLVGVGAEPMGTDMVAWDLVLPHFSQAAAKE